MAITQNDIKLFQAQDNTDNDSGGGSRTSAEVVDGNVNNLFPDISRIDTVSGDVALRKVFPAVDTANRDVYYGAHSIIRKPPTDEKVSALLFHTDDPHDIRSEAQNDIESYVVASYLEQFYLYGNHIEGARSVTFLQTLSEPVPSVGEVYLLKEGVTEQYIRVSSIEPQEITLTWQSGNTSSDYVRRRIICEIEQALTSDFTGSAFQPSGQQNNTCDTFATQIADAAKFYATKTLSVDASQDDLTIEVDSIYEQVVPASKTQTPLVNKQALLQGNGLLTTGHVHSENFTSVSGVNPDITLSHPVYPGTITQLWNTDFQDDGLGNIVDVTNNNSIVGQIDYVTGILSNLNLGVSGSVTANYTIATIIESEVQFSEAIKVTQENQGLVWVRNLSPIPSDNDLYIDYRANGKWYRFNMNADGTLGDDASIGAGLLSDNNDGTGTVSITLGALPDIDSSIIVSWGSTERLQDRSTFVAEQTQSWMEINLGQTNIDPASLTMSMYNPDASQFDIISGNADGTLSDAAGAITGRIDSTNGLVSIMDTASNNRFDNFGSVNNVTIDFDYANITPGNTGEIKSLVFSRTPVGQEVAWDSEDTNAGTVVFTIGESPIRESLKIVIRIRNYPGSSTNFRDVTLECDASGNLLIYGRHFEDTTTYGSVTVAGVVTLQLKQLSYTYVTSTVHFSSTPRYTSTTNYSQINDQVDVSYRAAAVPLYDLTGQIINTIENVANLKIQTLGGIVGEVRFVYRTDSTADSYNLYSKDGNVYTDDGLQRGTINYTTGLIELDYFNDPENFFIRFDSIYTDELAKAGLDLTRTMAFKTAADKLTTSSFQVRYTTSNGAQSATSDGNGVLTGTDLDVVESYVDTDTGMTYLVFTADLSPDSVFYDAVAETSLPLDPDLLGLNPVRLPVDGKVPVFDAGRHVVIFNEVETNISPDPVADAVVNLARTGQSYIEVIDANGKRLDPDQYTADKDLGTVTFANPLTLEDKYANALTAPYRVIDRVEDMLLATDVTINGLITLSAGLSRAYTNGITKVASALVWGDVGARYYNLFAQEIWDSGNPVWSDVIEGDPTTAQYDDINYPIQLDNANSASGRWAIIFTNATTVNVVEEKLGVVQSGISISIDDVAPVNPATGNPYFTMDRNGFGSGWVTNNVVRFNTDSGDVNMWVIRTVQSGALNEATDSIDIEIRGDAN